MASTRIHIDEARFGRVQKQDRIATGVLTAIVAIVMLIVVSMVAYILFEGISTLFQPGFSRSPRAPTEPKAACSTSCSTRSICC